MTIGSFLTDDQKLLRDVARKFAETVAAASAPAFALSEPEAGSDASGIATCAVRDGDNLARAFCRLH